MGRASNIQVCVTLSSCLVSFHTTKADAFERNRLYIRTHSKSVRVIVYLDPSVSVDTISDPALKFLLSQKFTVKFWSSIIPRTVSNTDEEIEDFIQSKMLKLTLTFPT